MRKAFCYLVRQSRPSGHRDDGGSQADLVLEIRAPSRGQALDLAVSRWLEEGEDPSSWGDVTVEWMP